MNITPINFNTNISAQAFNKTKKTDTISRQQYNTIPNCYYVPFKSRETGNKELSKQRQTKLKDLTDDEYTSTITNIAKTGPLSQGSSMFFMDKSYCNDVPLKYMGVIPYCGFEDCSYSINTWLDGRMKDVKSHEQQAIDVVSAMDYSLEQIDKDYGKYDGFVYRKGIFSESPNRYSSASMRLDPESYLFQSNHSFSLPYNIIHLKNGHKLNSMLKEYASSNLYALAEEENEILIGRKSKFKLVQPKDYSDETKQLVDNYFRIITGNIKNKPSENELREKVKINVWEEV